MTRRGLWLCFVVSVLMHAAVLALLPTLPDGPRTMRRATPIDLRILEAQPTTDSSPRAVQKTPGATPPVLAAPAIEPPSALAPAQPTEAKAPDRPVIDLGAARALAMEIAREAERSKEELVFESRRLDARHVLARGIALATVADCRTAYSGLLLLAVPMLVIDAFRDNGCRW